MTTNARIEYILEEFKNYVNYTGKRLQYRVGGELLEPDEITAAHILGEDNFDILLCGWTVATLSAFELLQFNKTTLILYADLLSTFAFSLEHKI